MAEMDYLRQTNPFPIIADWLAQAKACAQIKEPTAMILATANTNGMPSARAVLLKSYSPEGFVFFTNYDSRKGGELNANPQACLLFFWDPLFRQIKITGKVHRTLRQDSQDYWASRPRQSQLSGFISRQSQELAKGESLEQLVAEADKNLTGKEIPCPDNWGGFVLEPETIEFWIGRPNRLHDRYHFKRVGPNWTCHQLFP